MGKVKVTVGKEARETDAKRKVMTSAEADKEIKDSSAKKEKEAS